MVHFDLLVLEGSEYLLSSSRSELEPQQFDLYKIFYIYIIFLQ